MLKIENLSVNLNGTRLLHDINLNVSRGARHRIAGKNGSGKSTLAAVITGNPAYTVDCGKIIFDGHDITNENATTRALLGIFLGAQNVPEIPGLTITSLLKHSMTTHTHFKTGQDLSMGQFLEKLETAREQIGIPREWLNRSVNVGFSGGERKRIMLLRLILAEPLLAILDEPDSGADADTQRLIAETITSMPNTTFMFISHQQMFTDMVAPTTTTILENGSIIEHDSQK